MKFIKIGKHYINFNNINHVLRWNNSTVKIYFQGGSSETYGYILDLHGKDADEFEQKLSNLCD